MHPRSWLVELDELHASYLILLSLAALALVAAGLFYVGLLGWALKQFGRAVRWSVRLGFLTWERTLAWAAWPLFLAIVLGLLLLGWLVAGHVPELTVACAVVPLAMGMTACLAYMFIDLERYEVGRGYKAVHIHDGPKAPGGGDGFGGPHAVQRTPGVHKG